MKLTQFDSSVKLTTKHGDYFVVTDSSGKSGIYDPGKEEIIVPCDFKRVCPTSFETLWFVFEHGRSQGREFGSKGVAGIFDSDLKKLIVPTTCDYVTPYNKEWFIILVGSDKYFRWHKVGLYSVAERSLYIDTSYEDNWIPRWEELQVVNTPIPATGFSRVYQIPESFIEHDDVLILNVFEGVPVIFSKRLGKVIYPKGNK